MIFDVIVIGGGIVGMSTAWQLLKKRPGLRLGLLEAESRPAAHQTGNNSGVIHSGLYYKPGSLKARNCVRGREMLYDFCRTHGIPHDRCGKLVVATSPDEIPRLTALHDRGVQNGLKNIRLLSAGELREYEPAVSGVRGLHVQETGIVDFTAVTGKLAELVCAGGGTVCYETRFLGMEMSGGRLHLTTSRGDFHTGRLVNCAGLYSDRIARLCGVYPGLKIMPFRGEYYKLKPGSASLVNNLIYPVPDPQFPFLGVHFTRMINGDREAGPNAVLAFKREGYRKRDVSFNDMLDYLS
ncbi:MAG TPA: L-2-hydroxyglutarate oxidase, partial [bacterium]|nr:L-2-hydroxyglutarate oxidase [bacterium]